jgi:hypothetical protein
VHRLGEESRVAAQVCLYARRVALLKPVVESLRIGGKDEGFMREKLDSRALLQYFPQVAAVKWLMVVNKINYIVGE